ncbi:NAD(P)/FAD-dependent oxidoreductase [Anaeromyxobacter sp. Fw109-5]|uniref:phytoene desaturase family protein n=1 Tax=Anaeromyxobacter sp. (strain Fw109-5) TaxID=404589 RepID=UPI0003054CDA|nr:NAD(P)/FAD-dependent oxidoreductase [Anaeromyxobacter sp. Fw109-5]
MSAPDAIVVGAGPNGLAAAVALATAGLRVRVVERNAQVGGGARTLSLTLPGFHHDHCSAIHPLAAGSPFLRRLPLGAHGVTWVEPPIAVAHPFDDGTAALLSRSFEATGGSLDRGDARAWRALFAPLAERFPELMDELLGGLVRVPRRPLLLARFALPALVPASALARARFRGPRARALLAGLAAHAQLPLERAPSAAFALVLGAAAHAEGWPFPAGGAQAIPHALAALLRASGGEIVTGEEVRSLAALPRTRATLLDLTPRQVLRVAGDRLPRRYARALARFRYGPGAFKVDYALDGPIPWLAAECARAGTVHLGGTLEEIAASEAAVWRGELAVRPYVLVAQHTLFDPPRAPPGKHTAWAYCHVPSGFGGDALGALEAQLERFAPGFRERVLTRAVRGPAALEADDPNLVGGDVGAGANTLGQTLFRPAARLVPWSTPVPGLYLCSASTPPGGGVHGMCGYHAAQTALRRLW